jgi:hypothetical protein
MTFPHPTILPSKNDVVGVKIGAKKTTEFCLVVFTIGWACRWKVCPCSLSVNAFLSTCAILPRLLSSMNPLESEDEHSFRFSTLQAQQALTKIPTEERGAETN